MNKYQEALDRIMNDDYDFPNDYYGEDRATAMERDEETLQKLIERATPKKPLHEVMLFCDEYIETRLCPNCNENLPFKCNYCMDCGQSLDWGDEE